MDKEFIAMRKKGFVYDYGLQKWVKEPVGMYGDPALEQLFRPTQRAVDVCPTCGGSGRLVGKVDQINYRCAPCNGTGKRN